jgi:hypothetical protein
VNGVGVRTTDLGNYTSAAQTQSSVFLKSQNAAAGAQQQQVQNGTEEDDDEGLDRTVSKRVINKVPLGPGEYTNNVSLGEAALQNKLKEVQILADA